MRCAGAPMRRRGAQTGAEAANVPGLMTGAALGWVGLSLLSAVALRAARCIQPGGLRRSGQRPVQGR